MVIYAFPLRNIDPMRLITAFAGQARLIFALAIMANFRILRAADHLGAFRVAVDIRSVLPVPEFAQQRRELRRAAVNITNDVVIGNFFHPHLCWPPHTPDPHFRP